VLNLLETTVLALGISYIGFDLYFFVATFAWNRRLLTVNRDALMFSGFRELLQFVYQGPVSGVVRELAESAQTPEQAGHLVAGAYPDLRDRFGLTQEQVELPDRLLQLRKEAVSLRWFSAGLAVGITLLVVFAATIPFGFEVLIAAVLANSIAMIPFASTRVEIDGALHRAEDVLKRVRAARVTGGGTAPSANADRR
jgi:hypothetical protein